MTLESILALLLIGSVTFNNLANFSVPHILYLKAGDNKYMYTLDHCKNQMSEWRKALNLASSVFQVFNIISGFNDSFYCYY